MNQFRHTDTKKPDGFYIQWHMLTPRDDCADKPDERDDGFWPSTDPKAAGYIGSKSKAKFAAAQAAAQERMDAWRRDEWWYIGVVAEARCMIVRNGHGTFYEFKSAGLWGIESDSGDYLKEVFEEQKEELLADLAAMQNPIQEG